MRELVRTIVFFSIILAILFAYVVLYFYSWPVSIQKKAAVFSITNVTCIDGLVTVWIMDEGQNEASIEAEVQVEVDQIKRNVTSSDNVVVPRQILSLSVLGRVPDGHHNLRIASAFRSSEMNFTC